MNQLLEAIFFVLGRIGSIALFFLRTLQSLFRPPFYIGQIPQKMYEIGIKTLPVLVTVSAFVGMTLVVQGDIAFKQVNATGMLGLFCALAEIREMCPIMTAAMVCAKAGSQMAANIGTMKVKEQIDAMEVMSVDTYSYLVVPRFWAALFLMPFMVLISDVVAITASYLVAVYQLHQDGVVFIHQVKTNITSFDMLVGLCKGICFGAVIAVVCCYYGYNAEKGAEGVGAATNKAVVQSVMFCAVLNLFLTEFLYG